MQIEHYTFAVVPIFVNTGAAALPAVLAAMASVGALLFKPRALIQLLRRRWRTASLVTLGVAALALVLTWIGQANATSRRAQQNQRQQPGQIDWLKVAQDIIAQQKVRGATTVAAGQNTVAAAPANPPNGGLASSPRLAAAVSSPTGLNPLWSFKPESTMFLATPAIFGKRVFVAGCQSDLAGTRALSLAWMRTPASRSGKRLITEMTR